MEVQLVMIALQRINWQLVIFLVYMKYIQILAFMFYDKHRFNILLHGRYSAVKLIQRVVTLAQSFTALGI